VGKHRQKPENQLIFKSVKFNWALPRVTFYEKKRYS